MNSERGVTCERISLQRDGAAGPLRIIDRLDLVVDEGEFVALIGPSGCGKSSLLNIVAGLIEPTGGTVRVDGEADRLGHLALMPQADALLPWRTVADNVLTGPAIRRKDRATAAHDVNRVLGEFGLTGFEDHYPHALSGGMRQRVALARTVLCGARYWLLDEPFGALDAFTRHHLHGFLSSAWKRHRPTIILVTHDLDEALLLADRLVVLGARPAAVRADISVDLERPRSARTTTSERFLNLKQRAMDHLFAAGAFA